MPVTIHSPEVKNLRFKPEEQIEQDDDAILVFEVSNTNSAAKVLINEVFIDLTPTDIALIPFPGKIAWVIAQLGSQSVQLKAQYSVDGGAKYFPAPGGTGRTLTINPGEKYDSSSKMFTSTNQASPATYPYNANVTVRLSWSISHDFADVTHPPLAVTIKKD